MSSIDRYPRIVFGRTKVALTAMVSDQFDVPERQVSADRTIIGGNTVVAVFQKDALDLEQFEYCEILAISPVMASAPPLEAEDQEEDDIDNDYYEWGGPILEDRPSAVMERDLQIVGLVEVPVFGRRLLLISFDKGLSEFDMGRAKERVRKRLGYPVTVWQGRSFEGYCFVDNAIPISIASRLERTLVCDEVEDYLLVQPVAMVMEDKSGLSPLGDWVHSGWKNQPVSIPDHRSGQYGRRE